MGKFPEESVSSPELLSNVSQAGKLDMPRNLTWVDQYTPEADGAIDPTI